MHVIILIWALPEFKGGCMPVHIISCYTTYINLILRSERRKERRKEGRRDDDGSADPFAPLQGVVVTLISLVYTMPCNPRLATEDNKKTLHGNRRKCVFAHVPSLIPSFPPDRPSSFSPTSVQPPATPPTPIQALCTFLEEGLPR